MSSRKESVASYFDGFRRSDHEQILACLTDDVVWDIVGFTHLEGKEAFDGEIENDAFEGSPKLTVDRLIEEGDIVVAIGVGEGTLKGGAAHRFAFCTVFAFRVDKVCRVESYIVPLSSASG